MQHLLCQSRQSQGSGFSTCDSSQKGPNICQIIIITNRFQVTNGLQIANYYFLLYDPGPQPKMSTIPLPP